MKIHPLVTLLTAMWSFTGCTFEPQSAQNRKQSAVFPAVSFGEYLGLGVQLNTWDGEPLCLFPKHALNLENIDSGPPVDIPEEYVMKFAPCTEDARWAFRQTGAGYHIRSNAGCLAATINRGIELQPCQKEKRQLWLLEIPEVSIESFEAREYGFRIKNAKTGRYLGWDPLRPRYPGDRTRIPHQTYQKDAQVFDLFILGANTYPLTLHNVLTPTLCMGVIGTRIKTLPVYGDLLCNWQQDQMWSLIVDGNRAKIGYNGLALDTGATATGEVWLAPDSTSAYQDLSLRYMGDNTIAIKSQQGQCIGMDKTLQDSRLMQGDCNDYNNHWQLDLGRPLGAPKLLTPAHGATVGSKVNFSWKPDPGATSYTLCVAKPGDSCLTGPALYMDHITRTNQTMDLLQYRDSWVNWSVRSCQSAHGNNGTVEICSDYQQNVKSLFVDPTWDITVELVSIVARDHCDSRSSGEWQIPFFIIADSSLGTNSPRQMGIVEYDTAHLVTALRGESTIMLGGVKDHQDLRIAVGALDCDSSSDWHLHDAFVLNTAVTDNVPNERRACSGEDSNEVTSAHDTVGTMSYYFGPGAWVNKRGYDFSMDSGGTWECDTNAFTAVFSITSTRR